VTTDLRAHIDSALGRVYAVERELGRGGMATVYLAEDRKHKRRVAVKVMSPELGVTRDAERFLREIALVAQLNHPHILPLLDSGEAAGLLYFVMPYVEGESLRQRLVREGQLPVDDAMRIAREVADALHYAHGRDILHRDIKPENILLSDGHAVVADFGIAKAMSAAGGDAITQTGLAVGTPTYMSLEQAAGEARLDGRSDVYSLGVVLYEMLAGVPPFTGPTVQAVMAMRFAEPVPALRGVRETVPEVVERMVLRALAKSPADRFPSAAEFGRALTLAAGATPPGQTSTRAARAIEGSGVTPSIAVLPFANMSADPENEYFSDGITEEIINALTRVEGLRVAARTSSFAFKGKNQNVHTVADVLSVASVLEGSVRKAGNRVRITAQLVNVADGYHLWSERYDREITDVFAIQDEIARAIVETLRVRLIGRADAPLVKPSTANIEAYNLYLKGRYYWNRRNSVGLEKGMEYFQQAIQQDPNYALAYAGLADCYSVLGMYAYLPPLVACEKAEAAAARALALDATLAEAHLSAGLIAEWFIYEWPDAERAFQRAIALNHNYAEAHGFYAEFLCELGRFEEAIAQAATAQALAPVSPLVSALSGFVFYAARRHDEAIAECRKALDLDPEYPPALWVISWPLMEKGRHDEAIEALERVVQLSQRSALFVAWLAVAYARAGRAAAAQTLVEELLDRASREYVPPLHLGVAYLHLGDKERALVCVERAYEERNGHVAILKTFPVFDGLRAEPRFQAVLQKLALA
jgi:serine/threonine-protein kinase